MQHRIVEIPAFQAVGLKGTFEVGKVAGIPPLWDRFLERASEIEGAVPGVHFGVCEADPPVPPGSRPFSYTACAQVTSLARLPPGMVGLTLPAGRYAQFTVEGPISAFPAAVQAIWREAIPAAGLRPTGGPDFERYDDRFRGESPDSVVDVFIPVLGT